MNIKKFIRKTFPSFFPFETTPRTCAFLYEHLDELINRTNSVLSLYVEIYVKDGCFGKVWSMWSILRRRIEQDLENPCFNIKRKLINDVYEAEVLYEGEVLPYIALPEEGTNGVLLIPDSEEGLESLNEANKNFIMPFMSQVQQAKELIALNEAMKTGVQHA